MTLDKNQQYCIYCTAPFGAKVIYKNKLRILYKIKEHFYPRKAGGEGGDNLVYACQICNLIKRGLVFDSGVDAKNYILDQLLGSDWCIVDSEVK